MYNLEEMEPPETLACDLRPYQKQALYWMSELERGANAEETEKTLHPCWEAYRVCDERAPAIYVNNFSGEATTKFPTALQMARGGILADAMGLGKTVMTSCSGCVCVVLVLQMVSHRHSSSGCVYFVAMFEWKLIYARDLDDLQLQPFD